MWQSALSATNDLTRRLQLKLLTHLTPTPQRQQAQQGPQPRFRVSAWRWHHLAIVRDLTRLHSQALSRRATLCPPTGAASARDTRVDMLHALRYIITDNWQLHDHVERKLFIPWIVRKAPDAPLRRRVRVVERERARLAADSAVLARRVERWVDTEPRGCSRDLDAILGMVDALKQNASVLFEASEAFFIPKVRETFSEKEQLQFNSSVLKNITGKQARISLVIFKDAVDAQPSRLDRDAFDNDIPAAVRKVGLPYWRRKFVAHKVRFISDK